jgi:membrane-bound serine protease (ClpP class)
LESDKEIKMKANYRDNLTYLAIYTKILILLLFSLLTLNTAVAEQIKREYALYQPGKVLLLEMDMAIMPGTLSYLKEGLAVANRDKYALVLIKLSTPGGMLTTTQEIVKTIFSSKVPIVIFVAPSGATATSAGVFITLAAHLAVMSPASSIGSAHPVGGGGEDIGKDMRQKVENMASAMIRSISEKRGRNKKWAEAAVLKSVSVSAEEALEKKIIDFVANDTADLLAKLAGQKVEIQNKWYELKSFKGEELVYFAPAIKSQLLNFVANPTVLGILWLIATSGIATEIYSPGLIFPGVIGVLAMILSLISMEVLAVSTGAVVLLLAGLAFILIDIIVGSGIGFTIGIGSLIAGFIYLGSSWEGYGGWLLIFICVSISVLANLLFLGSNRKEKRLKTLTGLEAILGEEAELIKIINDNEGLISIEGETWRVTSFEKLTEGAKVKILAKEDGMVLSVKPI